MIDLESTRVFAFSGMALVGILGSGLTVAVGFAATMPIHEPVRDALVRVRTWARRAPSVALRAFYVALGFRLAYGMAVTYLHLGWRKSRHAYLYTLSGNLRRKPPGGRHRPEVVKANPWRPVLTWSKGIVTA